MKSASQYIRKNVSEPYVSISDFVIANKRTVDINVVGFIEYAANTILLNELFAFKKPKLQSNTQSFIFEITACLYF